MTYPDFCQDLYDQLLEELVLIAEEASDPVDRARRSAIFARTIAETLEGRLANAALADGDEIHFFKDTRPVFYSHLLFFEYVYRLELIRPAGRGETQSDFWRQELVRLQRFFDENRFIRMYLRSGQTYLDDRLFLRSKQGIPIGLTLYSASEKAGIATNYGDVAAQLRAGEMLEELLSKELAEADGKEWEKQYRRRLVWTGSKAGLIELGYALQAAGVFNEGKADLKEVMEALEWVFQVGLGNYPRAFQEILARKKGYTSFIDSMKDMLLMKIQRIEEKHLR